MPALAGGQDLVGRGGQFQVGGMARGLAPHGVDLLERPPDGLGGRVAVGVGPDRKEDARRRGRRACAGCRLARSRASRRGCSPRRQSSRVVSSCRSISTARCSRAGYARRIGLVWAAAESPASRRSELDHDARIAYSPAASLRPSLPARTLNCGFRSHCWNASRYSTMPRREYRR